MSRRLWSYRSGDIKENLGIALLQGIGFVSPTPRSDDVGIDAAVFLQRPEGRFLYPELGFYVQIKSSRVDRIEFDEKATQQLSRLKLPLYIVLVDGPKGEAALHSLNHLFTVFNGTAKTITLDKSYDAINASEDLSGWLDVPLMCWGLQNVFDHSFRDRAHAVLSEYLNIDIANIIYRGLGIHRHYDVVTNDKPVRVGERTMVMIPNYNPTDDIIALQSALPRIMMSLLHTHPEMEDQVMKLMASFAETMEALGIKPFKGPSFEWIVEQVKNVIKHERMIAIRQRTHPSEDENS